MGLAFYLGRQRGLSKTIAAHKLIDAMKRIAIELRFVALVAMVAVAAALPACKKELPSISVEKQEGVALNYDISELVVKNGSDILPTGARVKAGVELTIEPLKAAEGLKPRTMKEIKVNGGDNLVGADNLKISYTVKAEDEVVSIISVCEGGYIELLYKKDNIIVCELKDGNIGDEILPGSKVEVGQMLVLISKDNATKFKSITVNGSVNPKNLQILHDMKDIFAIYTVHEQDKKVEIEAQY